MRKYACPLWAACLLLVVPGVCLSIRAQAQEPAKLPPALAALAPDFLVVAGKGAPASEREAAETIAAALRAAGGPSGNLLDDETALGDLNRSAFHHLILVGTYRSNALLRQQWGHWSIDREAFHREHVVSDDVLPAPFYEGAPQSGFFIFGFNTFHHAGTGVLESGRNDLFLVPHAIDAPRKPNYKISIHITGVDCSGVTCAAAAFLREGLLSGVLPSPEETLPANGDAFVLGKEQYVSRLPAWVPNEQLFGWTQPDATEYAGFLQASGQTAQRIWRAKYLPAAGITDFDSSPQRRATANELWIAQLASPEVAQAAVAGLTNTLGRAPQKMAFETATLSGLPAQQAGGFHLAARGSWLFMESLPEPQGAQVLAAALAGSVR